ncbi:MAG: hypothetical protein CEO12_584 [Parcubacteria group bacterium Gr01-1014_46]|nr:MAG: hypothetical protein CEO12_584 [Parcubacteria group bacterium Gr01-1014_46]
MKRDIIIFCAVFLLSPFITSAFSGSEVHITKDGLATITDTKVMQIAGGTFFTRMYWGDSYVRLTIKTNSNTKFFRGTGEPTTLSEISVGDMLDVSGELGGSDVLTLTAVSVKNSSVQKKQTVFSGKVQSIDLNSKSFVLDDKKVGSVTVVATSTTRFIKGNRTLDLAHIVVGDFITKVAGDYNITTKTVVADSVITYVDPNYYKPKNFQGILKEINLISVPMSVKVSIDGKLFMVKLANNTSILNKARLPVSLGRFVLEDVVRLYGAIREIDEPIIDAEILRNISL